LDSGIGDMMPSATMIRLLASFAFALGLLASSVAGFAGERTVTLTVENMVCPVCSYTVKRTLERVSGVSKVIVSLQDKTAIVIYDDTKADVGALTRATANAGFPSAPKT
jgi:mercuric ion binding protein